LTLLGNANADFVEAVYRAVLDRNADPGGLANWTGLLNSGALSRLQVVQGIRNSPEHFTQEVSDFYFTLLNRPADPAGLQNWVQQLEAGMKEEQVAFYFLDSPEYLSQGDKHFVDAMYRSLLGPGQLSGRGLPGSATNHENKWHFSGRDRESEVLCLLCVLCVLCGGNLRVISG
jgi:hypothetical protein